MKTFKEVVHSAQRIIEKIRTEENASIKEAAYEIINEVKG